ncbi:PREDICTED: uncharacterized protein LOC107187073 isoform X2 [Dufourea novaeangliae]|uniref:uncharacterized protein LOC107187073 isoform X2 n=1 Tax=Dufourea novaeangliae TaxID=178035 RepID=UPI00076736C2|nr:PREDICTED: uncharacterized protein LOC107187073 isoform X2 [Dufourea novaeangliae]
MCVVYTGEKMGLKLRSFFTKFWNRAERPSRMVLTVTEDTPADMLAGSMELLVQLPREHHQQTQRVTVQRSTPMMDLLVQIATAHKLTASSYTLQAIGEHGIVLPHQPNTPIGALDALQVKLLPKQGTFVPRKTKQANQPFETTFRLQVHLPRNQLYVSRVSPKMNLGDILDEVCREKNLDRSKYELRHPASLETLDLSLSLQDYNLQEVTLYAKQGRTLGSALSTQDIMVLHRQEERRRQQAKQGVFGFVFKKSKESSLSTDSLGGRSASPARSDETGRSTSPLQPPARPQRKRRPAPKPPMDAQPKVSNSSEDNPGDSCKDKVVISHSRNSSDSSGYHEASVLSDNPDSAGRLPETLPRRSRLPVETSRKLAHTSQSSKSLSNLATVPGTLSHGISSTSLSSTGLRKKRAAPPPPATRPLSSAISTQALERIVDSEESLTSDIDPSKPPSDIGAPSKANSDIEDRPKANSDIGVTTLGTKIDFARPEPSKVDVEIKMDIEPRHRSGSVNVKLPSDQPGNTVPVTDAPVDARLPRKRVPKPRKTSTTSSTSMKPLAPKRRLAPPSPLSRTLDSVTSNVDHRLANAPVHFSNGSVTSDASSNALERPAINGNVGSTRSSTSDQRIEGQEELEDTSTCSVNEDEVFLTSGVDQSPASFDSASVTSEEMVNTMKKNENGTHEIEMSPKDQDIAVVKGEEPSLMAGRVVAGREKKMCAVISTMPKCEHLDELTEGKGSALFKTRNTEIRGSVDNATDQEGAKDSRRARIPRTASKSNDFEINSLEKQKRHFTSHAEDFTFALNLNVASNVRILSGQSKQLGEDLTKSNEKEEKSPCGLGASDSNLSETDVLLQKVSDTLSNSLPVSTAVEVPITRFVSPVGAKSGTTCKETPSPSIKKTPNEQDLKQQSNEFPDGAIVNTSTPNLTVNSQQDTSDYVSAADEDLSIADWEYQLPAPPSAFRDSASPVFDNFDEVISSPDSFRDAGSKEQTDRDLRNSLEKQETRTESKGTSEKEVRKEIFHEKLQRQPRSDCNLKKEVICELENKISTLPQGTKDFDSRKAIENSLTAKIAPVDKTLSNFTITTYTRQKSLNVFEEVQDQSRRRNNDERFIKSFATLSRNKSNLDETEDRAAKEISTGTLQGKKEVEDTDHAKLEQPKMQTESLHRWQSGNEKSNIQRSKSYMSVCDKPKFQEATCEDEVVRNNNNMVNMDNVGLKKATSITSLNATRSNNEKFSQWRDNILKRQEEPTKEKQLQSLQVLKSILPQLKNAQQAEENVSKESSDDMVVLPEKTRPETTSNERSIELNVVSTRSEGKSEPEQRKPPSETSSKRYTYSGPPAISLGSWSERPTVNVQIKMDKDYKLGTLKSNNRTIVNINGTRDEADGCNEESRRPRKVLEKSNQIEIVTSDRREPNELAKKLITHTTATGFKRPVLNKVYIESKSTNEKPVVTGVELKKSFLETKQSDDTIDTTPVNFKEVSKAFGQEICLRPKPKRITLNRRSDLQIENDSNKQNGHVHPETVRATNDQYLSNGSLDTSKPKKFTSVVGVNPSNQGNFSFGNRIGAKAGAAPPVIKGFRITNGKGDQDNENNRKETFKESSIPQPPRPPTMPVITGVTLKSTRPKSMPVQVDPRDTLLESIRNFGGRENLKSVSILT